MAARNDTVEVVLKDEATRSVLTMALWAMMSRPLAGSDVLALDAGDPTYDEVRMGVARDEFNGRFARLNHVRSQAELVESTVTGDTVIIEAPEAVAEQLREQRVGMEENAEVLFRASDDRRSRILVLYDAAGALLELLPTPAEAVA
jgi:hypothetical protein